MNIVIYIIAAIVILIVVIWLIGISLPKQRIETRNTIFNISAKKIFEVVTDNQNWQYRSDLKELNILTKENGIEAWEEISKDGNIIHFKTKEKKPYSYYSFNMESSVMTGYWVAEFTEIDHNKTQFTATEYIEMKNPFLRVLSYLFFDIGKYMETYQKDLQNKIESER